MAKLTTMQATAVAERVGVSARANASTDHEPGSVEWADVFNGTADMICDGMTGDEWEGFAPRQLSSSEVAMVRALVVL